MEGNQRKFPHFPLNKDILADRREAFVRLPQFLEDFVVKYIIYDKRDAIMASLIMNILCTTVPLTALLYKYPSSLARCIFDGIYIFHVLATLHTHDALRRTQKTVPRALPQGIAVSVALRSLPFLWHAPRHVQVTPCHHAPHRKQCF